jgi:hypothetical protein
MNHPAGMIRTRPGLHSVDRMDKHGGLSGASAK